MKWEVHLLVAVAGVILLETAINVCFKIRKRAFRNSEPGALVTGILDYGGDLYVTDLHCGTLLVPSVDLTGRIEMPEGTPPRMFRTRSDASGCRITSVEEGIDGSEEIVGVFGCSWTFGTALSDEETFAWKLQTARPQCRIRNYGVGGYSLYQMMLRLKQALEAVHLTTVVIAYLPWHDERNVGAFHRIPWFSAPYVRVRRTRDGDRVDYHSLRRPIRLLGSKQSALIHCCEYICNWLVGRGGDRAQVQRHTTEFLFSTIKAMCDHAKIRLLVVSLQHRNLHADFLTRAGFNWIGVVPNVMLPSEVSDYPWLLLPYDSHPNEAANRIFARQIDEALDRLERGETVVPSQAFLQQNMRAPETNSAQSRNIYTLY